MKEVLLMYSGGLDSLLSTIRLVNLGYKVNLIHFDNGCSIGTENVYRGVQKLIERFGTDKIKYLGVVSIISTIRAFKKIENLKLTEIISKYGDVTLSQYQCLVCRSAMYANALLYAKKYGFTEIAEGARRCQKFVVEHPQMILNYREFLQNFDIKLLTPVYNLENELEKENEILLSNVPLIAYEGKCLLGYPLCESNPIDEEIVEGTCRLFEKVLLPEMINYVNNPNNMNMLDYQKLNLKKTNWF